MTHLTSHVLSNVTQHARHAAAESSPWIVFLARLGYAAKGVVYALVGILAVLAALGRGGQVDDSKSALGTLTNEPGGKIILGIIALGLVGYALWCFVQALFDPERKGIDTKGLGKRAIAVIKGVLYASLVLAVLQMIFGWGTSGSGGDGAKHWTARVMAWPAGQWLVVAGGVGIAIYGLQQIYKAWTADLDDQLDLSALHQAAHNWTIRFCRFGMAARGVVFAVIGGFLVVAGVRHDPKQSKGFGDALRYLQEQTYGPWLLGAVALGLIAYGFYELVRARYRRIQPV